MGDPVAGLEPLAADPAELGPAEPPRRAGGQRG